MAESLNSFLAGLNNGVSNGIKLYTTVQDQQYRDRQEQYQRQRAAVADEQWTKQYDFTVGKENTRQEEWAQTEARANRQLDASIEHNRGLLAVQNRNAAVNEGTLSLSRRRYDDAYNEQQRQLRLGQLRNQVKGLMTGDDGLPITDAATLSARANASDGRDVNALLDLAVAEGMLSPERRANYRGGQLVPGPNGGVVLRLIGKSGEGKPIEGNAYLSERGTSERDDPIMEIPVSQLGQLAMGDAYTAAQRASTLQQEQLAAQREIEAAGATDATRRANGDPASLAALEQELGTTQARLEEAESLRQQAEQNPNQFNHRITGPGGLLERGFEPTAAGYFGNQATSLSGQATEIQRRLDIARSQGPRAQAQAEENLRQFEQRQRAQRLSLGDAGYLTAAGAAPAARAKAAEAETKARTTLAKDVAGRVQIPEDYEDRVSKANIYAAVSNLDPAILRRASQLGDVDAVVNQAAQNMASLGMDSGLEGFVMAAAQGIDPKAFADAYRGLPAMDESRRIEAALVRASEGDAGLLRSLGTLMQ